MNDKYSKEKDPTKQRKEYELKTEVTEVKPEYWAGRVHRADGSVINVTFSNIEYLLKRCEEKNNGKKITSA